LEKILVTKGFYFLELFEYNISTMQPTSELDIKYFPAPKIIVRLNWAE